MPIQKEKIQISGIAGKLDIKRTFMMAPVISRPSKGKWHPDSMKQDVENVLTGQLSVRKAAEIYNIPKSTLIDRVSAVKRGSSHHETSPNRPTPTDRPNNTTLVKKTIQQLSPIPDASKKQEVSRRQKSERSEVLTSSPYKTYLEEQNEKMKREVKSLVRGKRPLSGKFFPKSSRKTTKKNDEKEETTCSFWGESHDEDWIQCSSCQMWAHEACASIPETSDTYECDFCQNPDLNPTEHLWDELDLRLRSREMRPTSIVQLSVMLQEEWRCIPVDILHKLVESMPDRVAAVIGTREQPPVRTPEELWDRVLDAREKMAKNLDLFHNLVDSMPRRMRADVDAVRQPEDRFLICSDSLSAIQSLQHLNSDDPLVLRTQELFHTLLTSDYEIVVVWIPGYVGIPGNEAADAAAKDSAMNASEVYWHERCQDIQNYLKHMLCRQWEGEWSAQEGNKLRRIKNTVCVWDSSTRASQHEEILLTRLRIGLCHLTHGHLLRGEPQPECDICHVPP
ncbi:hypothetical protein ANN_14278 [Periplaneta americana]|uniref:Zinc finger PHD-type domain-containing protein n=1 Tax=Periplaneta americana TaxID=6978 RepID=A0ABQ8SX34_PERAM|nr:hypothetical protein ANN_14278 [Periplaneta americana]